MTNYVNDGANDAALDYISTRAEAVHICSGDPATHAAVLTNSLGSTVVGAGNFSLSDGDVSGRKQTLSALSIDAASASGTGAVMAVVGSDLILRKHNLAEVQAITAGNPIAISASTHEIRDPA